MNGDLCTESCSLTQEIRLISRRWIVRVLSRGRPRVVEGIGAERLWNRTLSERDLVRGRSGRYEGRVVADIRADCVLATVGSGLNGKDNAYVRSRNVEISEDS